MFIQTFTDAQGVEHVDAFFKIRTASSRKEISERLFLSEDWQETTVNSNENVNINYQVYYWVSEDAFNNGSAPYSLVKLASVTNQNFSFVPDETYDALTLEQKCEKHCKEQVIPYIQNPAE